MNKNKNKNKKLKKKKFKKKKKLGWEEYILNNFILKRHFPKF